MHNEITAQMRSAVSRKKKRYKKQGFDLDLSYVTDRIIAMGFPANNFEALYRNHIDDVVKFFKMNHDKNFKIYNLCRERDFDTSKFSGEVAKYPFDDHNPPAFSVLKDCIEDISNFLSKDEKNVVAINCKAGKGRTGVIVCCTLLYSRVCSNANAALTEYGNSRTENGKGVTIPSQIRYIHYFDWLVNNHYTYDPIPMRLNVIKLTSPYIGPCEIQFIISNESGSKLFKSRQYKVTKTTRDIVFNENITFPFCGDLKFEFFTRSVIKKTKRLCQCWLNTFFIPYHKTLVPSSSSVAYGHSRFTNFTTSPSQLSAASSSSQFTNYNSTLSDIYPDKFAYGGSNSKCIGKLNDDHSDQTFGGSYRVCSPIIRQPFNLNNDNNTPKSIWKRISKSCSENLDTAHNEPVEEEKGTFDVSDHDETVYKIELTKSEVDKANKDNACRIFPNNFTITFIFSSVTLIPFLNSNNNNKNLGNSCFFTGNAEPPSDNNSLVKDLENEWKSSSAKLYLSSL